MKLSELTIIALSASESSKNNYVLILEERRGFRRLPIIIGEQEAQAIAIALEQMNVNRPLTHDLIVSIVSQLSHKLSHVIISDYKDEIFYAQLILVNADDTTSVIDCRPSDAIALAIRTPCPIFTTEDVLQAAGITLENPGKSFGEKKGGLEKYDISELKALLEKLLNKEDYESATKVRDIINRKEVDLE